MITKGDYKTALSIVKEYQKKKYKELPYEEGIYKIGFITTPATRNKVDGKVMFMSSRFGGKGHIPTYELAPKHLEIHFEPNKI